MPHNLGQLLQHEISYKKLVLIYFLALPFFYAFSGCNTVSGFYGKCKAYDVWVKVKEKMISLTSDHMTCSRVLCCS